MIRLSFALVLCAAGLLVGCGGATPAAQPWFCPLQGNPEDTLQAFERRLSPRWVEPAGRVLADDDAEPCWGNAALLLGALGADGAPILRRVDRVAAAPGGSALQADALLIGHGLTVRASDDGERVRGVVEALTTRADPAWWFERAPADDAQPGARRRLAEMRARSALLGLSWSGTRAAETALTAMRDAPPGDGRFDPPPPGVMGELIRRNRAVRGHAPTHAGR